jgi:choline-sulfatase
MADQLNTHAVPAYGNRTVDAKHLTALGESGVIFDAAYCNSPLCAPSRASMMTGRLPSQIGVYDNGAELPASVPTLAHYLRMGGYRTCLAGKMHFVGPDQLHGFEQRVTTDLYPAGLDWTPDWNRPASDRLLWYHDMSSVLEAGVSAASLQIDFDEEVAFRAVRAIYDLARSDDGRPFFLLASFAHPHDPWEVPQSCWDRYDGVEIDPPSIPEIPDSRLDPHSRRIREMCGQQGLEIAEQTVLNARRGYYAAVSFLDEKVGRLLGALDATGMRQSTIVIFTSDHGEMLGERGLWYKMSFFEPSARVPLIVSAPGRFGPRRVSQNVSLVDLLPTLVELAGGGHPFGPGEPAAGVSLMPLLDGRGGGPPGPDQVIGEYLAEGTHGPLVMIRRGSLKFVRCPGDPDQLFDLRTDPQELVNLAQMREHNSAVQTFSHEIATRWNLGTLRDQVVASQRRRRVVVDALSTGRKPSWDYSPPDDSSTRYVRGLDFWAPFATARLPRAGR